MRSRISNDFGVLALVGSSLGSNSWTISGDPGGVRDNRGVACLSMGLGVACLISGLGVLACRITGLTVKPCCLGGVMRSW